MFVIVEQEDVDVRMMVEVVGVQFGEALVEFVESGENAVGFLVVLGAVAGMSAELDEVDDGVRGGFGSLVCLARCG